MISIQEARAMLPRVGDSRMETPTAPFHLEGAPERCVVIEVHPAHLYYRVRFNETGLTECYKVPPTKRLSWEE